MAKHTKIVVLGAGYAGLMAALRLSGKTRKLNTEIVLVNGTDSFIERPRLHQHRRPARLRDRRPPRPRERRLPVHPCRRQSAERHPVRRAATVQAQVAGPTPRGTGSRAGGPPSRPRGRPGRPCPRPPFVRRRRLALDEIHQLRAIEADAGEPETRRELDFRETAARARHGDLVAVRRHGREDRPLGPIASPPGSG